MFLYLGQDGGFFAGIMQFGDLGSAVSGSARSGSCVYCNSFETVFIFHVYVACTFDMCIKLLLIICMLHSCPS